MGKGGSERSGGREAPWFLTPDDVKNAHIKCLREIGPKNTKTVIELTEPLDRGVTRYIESRSHAGHVSMND